MDMYHLLLKKLIFYYFFNIVRLMINKYNTPDGSYTTERILVNYINKKSCNSFRNHNSILSCLNISRYFIHITPYIKHHTLRVINRLI